MIPLILKWTYALEDDEPFAKKNIQIWVNIISNIKRLGVSNNVDPKINLQIIMLSYLFIYFSDSRSLHTVGSTSRRSTALADDDVEQQSEKVSTRNDFDTLLKRARAGIRNNKW